MALGLGSLPSDKVLVGGEVVESRVRALVVVEELVLEEFLGDGFDGEVAIEEVPELDAGGAVGAFDVSVPLRASRRQDAQRDAEFLAGVLELAAAVDLDGLYGRGEGLDDGVEEAPRASARSVLKAVAREKTRATMNRLTGQTARNSLMVRPSREKVMWSIWTSWPGRSALSPYFQRRAQPSNLRRRLGLTRPSQTLARGTAPAAMARERMRPTVDTLRRRPLRSSMRWIGALPMNGCLRRRSRTAFASLGLYERRRTRRGRVDFGARPRWPLAASAAFHRHIVRRLTPISLEAAGAAQPAARSSSYRRIADRRSRASAGRSASSTLKLRYDRVRIDSIFMVRVSIQWVCVH